jgi:hypothetical protein
MTKLVEALIPNTTLYGYESLEEIKQKIASIEELVIAETYTDVHLAIKEDYGDTVVCFYGKRLETEPEKAARLKAEHANLDWRRRQYEVLKKEFEEK